MRFKHLNHLPQGLGISIKEIGNSFSEEEDLSKLLEEIPDEIELTGGEPPDKIPPRDRPLDYKFQTWEEPDICLRYFPPKKSD